jgi:polyhydroxyalkanoate synthesis regulator phasin
VRQAQWMSHQLQSQRKELEQAVEDGVRRALAGLRLPRREQVEALGQRIGQLESRVSRLGGGGQGESH